MVTKGVVTILEPAFTESDYIIGAGAMLTAGERTTITRATLHAQVLDGHGVGSTGVVVDFDSSRPSELKRLLILGVGLSPQNFHDGVTSRLVGSGDCDLERLIELLASGLQTRRIHWFARWAPTDSVLQNLQTHGVTLVVKPLDAIARAALVMDRSYNAWNADAELAA
ncbi:MAG: hypothetical protein M3160_01300 [Candidatus Eremiobacteraeota bacterium]|nr:hypothetical protein [Candidatus Eremiobacteraeota bacterium]